MNTNEPSNRGKALALTGVIFQAGPIIGAIGTAIGMLRAFSTLQADGISDPRVLSANIGEVLTATIIGFGLGVVGLVLIILALFVSRYREEWFYWFLVIYGAVLLAGFPIGTLLGIVILTYCLTNRSEFLRRPEPQRNG